MTPVTSSIPDPLPEPWGELSLEEARAKLPEGPRVGIVHDWLNGMRGGEKVLEVILELFPDAPIYTLFLQRDKLSDAIKEHPISTSLLNSIPGADRYYRHMLPLMPFAMQTQKFRDIDLLVSTSHCVAKAAIAPHGVPHACYCHAPMRYIWDQFDAYFGPGKTSLPVRAAMNTLRKPLQVWDRATSKRVNYFLCNGVNIAGQIQKRYDRDALVIHPPVDLERYQPGDVSPDDRRNAPWLVVSALVPYKRVDLAIRAAAERGDSLIVAGRGPEADRLKSLAAELNADVTFHGWVSDDDLLRYYQTSRGFFFPGEEDFGITPLEAMACGCPVAAFARGGALETVADGTTGVFFKEQSTEALLEAMQRLDETAWDATKMHDHVRNFRREACLLNFARTLAWVVEQHHEQ
jgi:glycosyltransferase involved in cell wall biosynthesis